MSTMAHAMAKAGLIDKDTASDVNNKREEAVKKHKHLSNQITLKMADKRKILRMRDGLLKMAKEGSYHNIKNASLIHDILLHLGLSPINFAALANQRFILKTFQTKLAEIEKDVKPLIISCRKLEKEWGLKKNVRSSSK